MLPFHLRRLLCCACLLPTLCLFSTEAGAQLRLPSIGLPGPQRIGPLDTGSLQTAPDRLLDSTDTRLESGVQTLRSMQIRKLLNGHRDVLEADPLGEPIVKHEILAWSPSAEGLAAVETAGLTIVRQEVLDGLDQKVVTLHVPDNTNTADMLKRLHTLDPQGIYDFNHIYTGSAATPVDGNPIASKATSSIATKMRSVNIGLVDSGVDTGHAVFRNARIHPWGCGDAQHPDSHGTAVAALMVGRSSHFRGVAPEAELYAADVYCDSTTGGSVDRIAAALAWLAKEDIGVINLSLVGPPNRMLEQVVGAMVRRGHLLVAAVGNDGPAAPPLYPASYPGVIGVSAVDAEGRCLPESARGPQVMFAAPGSDMVTASSGRPPYRQVRGTSFAAPIVSALLAPGLPHPDKTAAKNAIASLATQAEKKNKVERTDDIGYGIVGSMYRVDPSDFR